PRDPRPDEVGYPAVRERNHRHAARMRLEVHLPDRLAQAGEGEHVRRVVVGSQLTVLDRPDESRRTFERPSPLFEFGACAAVAHDHEPHVAYALAQLDHRVDQEADALRLPAPGDGEAADREDDGLAGRDPELPALLLPG